MTQTAITQLVNDHKWTALIELATEEGMVLKFPDPESLESFRAYAYSKNAYGKVVSLSVRRKQLEITVAKAEEA